MKDLTPNQLYAAKYLTVLKRQAREWAEKNHPELLVKKDSTNPANSQPHTTPTINDLRRDGTLPQSKKKSDNGQIV